MFQEGESKCRGPEWGTGLASPMHLRNLGWLV